MTLYLVRLRLDWLVVHVHHVPADARHGPDFVLYESAESAGSYKTYVDRLFSSRPLCKSYGKDGKRSVIAMPSVRQSDALHLLLNRVGKHRVLSLFGTWGHSVQDSKFAEVKIRCCVVLTSTDSFKLNPFLNARRAVLWYLFITRESPASVAPELAMVLIKF